jgi:hypothetical protein
MSIKFTDPLPTSSNRDSAASLASSLVLLRPECHASDLGIASLCYSTYEKGCIAVAFRDALSTADSCARRGFYSTCQCYQDNVIAAMGVVCSIDIAVKNEFVFMCQRLSSCQSAEIINVCANALSSTGNRFVWAFGAFGGLVGAVIVVYYAVRKVLLRPAPVRMHKD